MNREQTKTAVIELLESAEPGINVDTYALALCVNLNIPSLLRKEASRNIVALLKDCWRSGVFDPDVVSSHVADWLLERGYGQ